MLLRLRNHKLLNALKVLLEIVLARVIALKLDLINHSLWWLFKTHIFNQILKSESMLLIGLCFLHFLVNLLLPDRVLWIWSKLQHWNLHMAHSVV